MVELYYVNDWCLTDSIVLVYILFKNLIIFQTVVVTIDIFFTITNDMDMPQCIRHRTGTRFSFTGTTNHLKHA